MTLWKQKKGKSDPNNPAEHGKQNRPPLGRPEFIQPVIHLSKLAFKTVNPLFEKFEIPGPGRGLLRFNLLLNVKGPVWIREITHRCRVCAIFPNHLTNLPGRNILFGPRTAR